MDERAIKKMLVTLAVAIVIIMLAKFMLTKTFTNLSKAAEVKKQQAAIQKTIPVQSEVASTIEAPVSSSSVEISAASAAEDTEKLIKYNQ